MSNAMVSQSVNRQNVGLALRQMRQECQYNGSELNAINRAALNLEACTWQFDGELLTIESATTMFKKYTVAHNGCDCKAGQRGNPCWHMAAYTLLTRAAQLALAPAVKQFTDAEHARNQALVDDLF